MEIKILENDKVEFETSNGSNYLFNSENLDFLNKYKEQLLWKNRSKLNFFYVIVMSKPLPQSHIQI